ncbi:MAG: pseudouridine synthase [Gemmatimonadota bacterium]|nr:MAG: pseudouridine synthase [Gemmatimonadota bacterium]
MRLQKFLSRAGVASRRQAETLIEGGRIRVNGEVVTVLGTQVDPTRDRVVFDGRHVELKAPRFIALNKPPGVLTTERDARGRQTIYDVLPGDIGGLRYVGRLDLYTEGLLLLTNDGDVASRLLHPRTGVEREYEATVKGAVTPDTLTRLTAGVTLDDGPARAQRASVLEQRERSTRLTLVLAEGRKREVRRMLSAVGHEVMALRRVRFGPIELAGLARGEWRELTKDEVRALRTIAAGPAH